MSFGLAPLVSVIHTLITFAAPAPTVGEVFVKLILYNNVPLVDAVKQSIKVPEPFLAVLAESIVIPPQFDKRVKIGDVFAAIYYLKL